MDYNNIGITPTQNPTPVGPTPTPMNAQVNTNMAVNTPVSTPVAPVENQVTNTVPVSQNLGENTTNTDNKPKFSKENPPADDDYSEEAMLWREQNVDEGDIVIEEDFQIDLDVADVSADQNPMSGTIANNGASPTVDATPIELGEEQSGNITF